MFGTNNDLGSGNARIRQICLEHITSIMLNLVKGYKDYWDDMIEFDSTKESFGTYLTDVSPKAMKLGKERVALYKSLVELLETPREEELTIEQEYMLFHIIDWYVESANYEVEYNIDYRVAMAEVNNKFGADVETYEFYSVYPNLWYIKNDFARNLVIEDMRIVANEIFEDMLFDTPKGEKAAFKKAKKAKIEEILNGLMEQVENIRTYADLLDDADWEVLDEIPNIREI